MNEAPHIAKKRAVEGSGTATNPVNRIWTFSESSPALDPVIIVNSYWCDARKSVSTLMLAKPIPKLGSQEKLTGAENGPFQL